MKKTSPHTQAPSNALTPNIGGAERQFCPSTTLPTRQRHWSRQRRGPHPDDEHVRARTPHLSEYRATNRPNIAPPRNMSPNPLRSVDPNQWSTLPDESVTSRLVVVRDLRAAFHEEGPREPRSVAGRLQYTNRAPREFVISATHHSHLAAAVGPLVRRVHETAQRNERPDRFDDTEGPRSRQKSIDAREYAAH